jgi:citrate synthase
MANLKDKLAEIIPGLREELKSMGKEYGNKVISQVTAEQAFGGMRGVKCLVCDTSSVEADKGLIIRGIPVLELTDLVPEEIFYLLCTGTKPEKEDLINLQKEFKKRSKVPQYVWDVLKAMPKDSHPMVMFNTAILIMEKESIFRKEYDAGMKKDEYWVATLEDALNLAAKLPTIAAFIYRLRYKKGKRIPSNPKLDWAGDYVHMLGIPDPKDDFKKLMRLYLVLHSDHESGNVSAFTCHTVGSALSDPYYAVSAGLNGLAGPLHGLANQECLKWILMVKKKFNGVPSDEDLKKFAWETLNSGKVVPGYGHAVLRVTDPRFTAFINFGKQYMPDDVVFQIVAKVFDVVPDVLKEVQKIKDPWPNVDAGSGGLLYHYGLKEFDYYTVLFSVSRALGMLSQLIWNRAVGAPITRPKSVTTAWIKQEVVKQN